MTSAIPVIGGVVSSIFKVASKGAKLASHLIDRVKDECTQLALSSLALKVAKTKQRNERWL